MSCTINLKVTFNQMSWQNEQLFEDVVETAWLIRYSENISTDDDDYRWRLMQLHKILFFK